MFLLEGKVIVLFVLLLMNVLGLRGKLRKKLENGIERTKVQMCASWFVRGIGEENAGIHEISALFVNGK
jgi:hypothetical protein